MVTRDVKRQFLQTIINRGSIRLAESKGILDAICEKHGSEAPPNESEILQMIERINSKIADLDQKINVIKHDIDKTTYLVFTNTAESKIHKEQIGYSEDDRNYFRLILRELACSEGFSLNPIVLLNTANQLQSGKTFSKTHAEELLQDWIESGYFLKDGGLVYFGPKVISEFSNYLRTNYPDNIRPCTLCREIVFWGTPCAECEIQFHKDCIRKYLRKMSKCPSCKKIWNTEIN